MASAGRAAKPVNPIKSFFVGDEPMTNGLWGTVFFLFTEAMFFSGLIAAYLALRQDALVWAPIIGGQAVPEAGVEASFRPVFFTVLLVASSFPMQYAAFSIRKGNRKGMQIGLALTIVMGVVFLVGQGVEWIEADFGISSGGYGATFYVLTGFHGAHVFGGMLFIMFLFVRSHLGHFDAKRNTAVEAATLYWHFVDVVWILLFSLIFLS